MKLNEEKRREPVDVEELHPGLVRVPLQTVTLPPATRTNSFLVRGDTKWWLVEIGSGDVDELAHLDAAIDAVVGDESFGGLILTHHHGDHVAGLGAWLEASDDRIVCHAETRAHLPVLGGASGRVVVVDGDTTLDGLKLWHTPGHAPGHLTIETSERHLIAGDLVAGVGTIIIAPPEGDMALYLESLERMRDRDLVWIHPAHGPSSRARARLDAYIAHRRAREDRVISAVESVGEGTLEEITALAYDDVPDGFFPLAVRSVEAYVIKLAAESRVKWADGRVRISNGN